MNMSLPSANASSSSNSTVDSSFADAMRQSTTDQSNSTSTSNSAFQSNASTTPKSSTNQGINQPSQAPTLNQQGESNGTSSTSASTSSTEADGNDASTKKSVSTSATSPDGPAQAAPASGKTNVAADPKSVAADPGEIDSEAAQTAIAGSTTPASSRTGIPGPWQQHTDDAGEDQAKSADPSTTPAAKGSQQQVAGAKPGKAALTGQQATANSAISAKDSTDADPNKPVTAVSEDDSEASQDTDTPGDKASSQDVSAVAQPVVLSIDPLVAAGKPGESSVSKLHSAAKGGSPVPDEKDAKHTANDSKKTAVNANAATVQGTVIAPATVTAVDPKTVTPVTATPGSANSAADSTTSSATGIHAGAAGANQNNAANAIQASNATAATANASGIQDKSADPASTAVDANADKPVTAGSVSNAGVTANATGTSGVAGVTATGATADSRSLLQGGTGSLASAQRHVTGSQDPNELTVKSYEAPAPNQLEVGISGGSMGWLKVRAELNENGEVHAYLHSASAGAEETLRSQSSQMQSYLSSQEVRVTGLHVEPAQSGSNSSGSFNSDAGMAQQQQQQKQQQSNSQSGSFSAGTSSFDNDKDSNLSSWPVVSNLPVAAVPGGGLGMTGGWVSVRA
jgi:hypothetical protein